MSHVIICGFAGRLANCPFGLHVLELLNLDAEGEDAAKLLDVGRSQVIGFGLYSRVSLFDIVVSGWPSFGLLHRVCQSRFRHDACEGRLGTKPAAASVVVAAAAARRQFEVNYSESSEILDRSDLDILRDLGLALERVKMMWMARWDGNEDVVSQWLGLDPQYPCCQMWAELALLQRLLRQHFEVPCVSGHRRVDGAVCPACRLPAQSVWLEERQVANEALRNLQPLEADFSTMSGVATLGEHTLGEHTVGVATVLTSEDLFRSIRHDGPGNWHSEDDDLADANAIVLAYVDAVRTLAFSIQKTSAQKRPLLIFLSLRTGESLPKEAQDSLEALEEEGLTKLLHLPTAPEHLWPRAWGKLQLWKPRGFELLLYLDADTLVLDNLETLFHAAEKLEAGANFSLAVALTRSMMGLNSGVMLLRPSLHIFTALQQSLEDLPQWQGISRWTGRPWSNAREMFEDQDHLNEWVATHLEFLGELDMDGSCQKQAWHVSYEAVRADGPAIQKSLGGFCTLPVEFNFCATAGCLRQLVGEHLLARDALKSHRLPGLQVLHWPGALRKPWQRCHVATRSRLDVLWWQVFEEACAVAPVKAPCTLHCFFQ